MGDVCWLLPTRKQPCCTSRPPCRRDHRSWGGAAEPIWPLPSWAVPGRCRQYFLPTEGCLTPPPSWAVSGRSPPPKKFEEKNHQKTLFFFPKNTVFFPKTLFCSQKTMFFSPKNTVLGLFLTKTKINGKGGYSPPHSGRKKTEMQKVLVLVLFSCPWCANFWSVYAHRMFIGAYFWLQLCLCLGN